MVSYLTWSLVLRLLEVLLQSDVVAYLDKLPLSRARFYLSHVETPHVVVEPELRVDTSVNEELALVHETGVVSPPFRTSGIFQLFPLGFLLSPKSLLLVV